MQGRALTPREDISWRPGTGVYKVRLIIENGHMPMLDLARCHRVVSHTGEMRAADLVPQWFLSNLSSVPLSVQVAQEEVGNILAFFIPSMACIIQVGAVPGSGLFKTAGWCLRGP